MAIDPGAFGEGFPARVDALCQALRSSPAADPAAPVRVPGDRPHRERLAREAEGITLPDPVVADLGTLAGSMGLAPVA
jgi:LDH2 family malate/lactate/ureidoglycolate dehydrogenase